MYIFCFAYRHTNGDEEGFVGVGFTDVTAKYNAVAKLQEKLKIMGQEIDYSRMIESEEELTPDEEMEVIRKDWEISKRSDVI